MKQILGKRQILSKMSCILSFHQMFGLILALHFVRLLHLLFSMFLLELSLFTQEYFEPEDDTYKNFSTTVMYQLPTFHVHQHLRIFMLFFNKCVLICGLLCLCLKHSSVCCEYFSHKRNIYIEMTALTMTEEIITSTPHTTRNPSFEKQTPHVGLADLELAVQLTMTLNFWSS